MAAGSSHAAFARARRCALYKIAKQHPNSAYRRGHRYREPAAVFYTRQGKTASWATVQHGHMSNGESFLYYTLSTMRDGHTTTRTIYSRSELNVEIRRSVAECLTGRCPIAPAD